VLNFNFDWKFYKGDVPAGQSPGIGWFRKAFSIHANEKIARYFSVLMEFIITVKSGLTELILVKGQTDIFHFNMI
jgi:hypothetical protein